MRRSLGEHADCFQSLSRRRAFVQLLLQRDVDGILQVILLDCRFNRDDEGDQSDALADRMELSYRVNFSELRHHEDE